jgi:hypothetical protein
VALARQDRFNIMKLHPQHSNYCSLSPLEAQVIQMPIHCTQCIGAGAGAAGEQATDHCGCESGEADQQQLNPQASQCQCSGVHWQAVARQQQLINLMQYDLDHVWAGA